MNHCRNLIMKLPLCALVICCLSCSGEGTEVDLGQVTGVVTMDGQPLADVVVVFMPDKGNPSSGITDSSGNYELAYLGDSKGALVGQHKVSITTKAPSDSASAGGDDTDYSKMENADTLNVELAGADELDKSVTKSKKSKESIPAKYNTKTELKGDVVSGDNTINFDLKSK